MLRNPLLRRALAALAAVAVVAAVCLAIVLVRYWKASRIAAAQMQAVFHAQAPVLADAVKRERQRDAALARSLAQISRADRAAKTPAELARRLPATLAPLPRPISVEIAPRSSGLSQDEPGSPAIITVPQADLKPLLDQLETCRACQQQLAAAQQDLSDERAKVSALTAERNAAVKAVGSGFWARFRTGAKWFLIGAAGGALTVAALRR